MEEFLNSEYSDDSTEADSFSNASAEEQSSDDVDLPLPPPSLPRDHFGVPANHSANYIGTSYPTYTPIPLRSSNGIRGIRRACFPLVNFEPTSTIEISKMSQYNFQARRRALRAFPPTRALEHRKYHMSREHSLAASKLHRQLGEEHIPQDLLAGLSFESDAETSFSHIYNPLSGNQMCLTQVNSTTHAVFTSGTLGNQLQCQSIDEASLKDWQDSPSPAFMTPIQQLTSNDTLIGVRSFGGIAFIEMPFRLHGELPLPNTPTDFTFHPTLRRLTASVTTGLDIYLWGLGDERPEFLACPFTKDPAIDHFMSNLGCVRFGSHPRSLIVGTTEEICIIDARTFTAKAQTIEIALPDRIWGFDINPTNPFQLATSTSEALILYDLRYLQRPTLDWRHAAKALPRPHVKFIPSRALLDKECVTSWGSLQGPLVYPLDGTSMILDPFQFSLPGSRRAPCSLGQLYPDRISEPTSLYPFGFLEDPGALTQLGCILRPTNVGAIEMFQLTEDGAVYHQVFDRVSLVEEQLRFDAIENCSVQMQPHFSPRLEADSKHSLAKTFEAWINSPCSNQPSENIPTGPFSSYDIGVSESNLDVIKCPWIDVMKQENYLSTQTLDGWKQRLTSTLDCLGDGSEEVLAEDLSAAARVYYPKTSDSPKLGLTATKMLEEWGDDDKEADVTPVEAPQFLQASQKLPPSIMSSQPTNQMTSYISQPAAGVTSQPSSSRFSFSQPPRTSVGRKPVLSRVKPKLPGFR